VIVGSSRCHAVSARKAYVVGYLDDAERQLLTGVAEREVS
jgi:hypothetical protein